MITAGAEKITNTNEEYVVSYEMVVLLSDFTFNSLMISDDIDAIIQCEEERTVELNTK